MPPSPPRDNPPPLLPPPAKPTGMGMPPPLYGGLDHFVGAGLDTAQVGFRWGGIRRSTLSGAYSITEHTQRSILNNAAHSAEHTQ